MRSSEFGVRSAECGVDRDAGFGRAFADATVQLFPPSTPSFTNY